MRTLPALLLLGIVAATSAFAESQAPGERFSVDIGQLPAPFQTDSAHNSPVIVDKPEGAGLTLPEGFTATLITDKLPEARKLLVAPNGDIIVARSQEGTITIVRQNTGAAATVSDFLDGFDRPYGLALHDNALYVADGRGVYRIPYTTGDLTAKGPAIMVTQKGAFGGTGGPGGHWTRNLLFAPDGKHFYVAIGSENNVAEDPLPRASIQEFNSDGSGQRTFASGLRNPIGLAWGPGDGALYTVVNERDTLGDNLVPDYLTHVQDGGFYGWPYAYLGQHKQPGELGEKHPEMVAKAIVPDVLFNSHSAPLDLVFSSGKSFPDPYRNGAFVSFHGSWNNHEPTGYKVVFVPFKDGHPLNEYTNFATGFRTGDIDTRARVWGRPVGLAIDADGNLLISEDAAGTLWKVTHSSTIHNQQ